MATRSLISDSVYLHVGYNVTLISFILVKSTGQVSIYYYTKKKKKVKPLNPCLAGPGYIRFQESFNPNKMPLKLIKYSVVDAQLIKYFNLGAVYFS